MWRIPHKFIYKLSKDRPRPAEWKRGERKQELWHYWILFPGCYHGIQWAGGWGRPESSSPQNNERGLLQSSCLSSALLPLCIRGSTKLWGAASLEICWSVFWWLKVEIVTVPYMCKKVLNLLTGKAERFACSDYHWNFENNFYFPWYFSVQFCFIASI